MTTRDMWISHGLGMVGAAIGGALGVLGYNWMLDRGFYALILPGAGLGLGCCLLARHRSWPRGLICGLAGLALGLFTIWQRSIEPRPGFLEFLSRTTHFSAVTYLMLGLGTIFALWWGRDYQFRGGGRRIDGY